MTDIRSMLERTDRAVSRVPMPSDGLQRLERRRDRKGRNQRVAAGVVGLAVFVAAVWIVTTGGPFDRTQTPATPGDTAVIGPSVPPDPDGGSSFGVPPEGADPSSPERGELVITFYGRPVSTGEAQTPVLQVLVYADGRVIRRQENGPLGANGILTGFLEQRLTLEGVELLRSEVISSGLFDRDRALGVPWPTPPSPCCVNESIWGEIRVDDGDRFVSVRWGTDLGPPTKKTATLAQARAIRRLNDLFEVPASVLPASAWEDPEIKAYVPSRYAICYWQDGPPLEPSQVLNLLPTPAEDLLLGRDRTYEPMEGGGGQQGCSEVTTEEARALDVIFNDSMLILRDSGVPRPGIRPERTGPHPVRADPPARTVVLLSWVRAMWIDPKSFHGEAA